MSRFSGLWGYIVVLVVSFAVQLGGDVPCLANVTREEVERAIREGVRYLKNQQRADGSWSDVENEAKTGTTSLITLALLTAGEKVESPVIRKALDFFARREQCESNQAGGAGLRLVSTSDHDPSARCWFFKYRTPSRNRGPLHLLASHVGQTRHVAANWTAGWTTRTTI